MSVEVREEHGVAGARAGVERDASQARAADISARATGVRSRGLALVRDVRLLLIALWLGAAVFFSFAVAPSTFAVLPTHELAGRLVTRTLTIVNVGGFVISLALLASAPLFRRLARRRAFYAELSALALVALTTGVGHWIINARLLALRLSLGRPIDDVAQSDPVRVAFNSLHGYSVMALTLGMLAALAALLLISRRAAVSTSKVREDLS
jgi:hypothetical protein